MMDNSVFTPEQVLEKIMQAAVLISTAAKDAVGKLMGVFFPLHWAISWGQWYVWHFHCIWREKADRKGLSFFVGICYNAKK